MSLTEQLASSLQGSLSGGHPLMAFLAAFFGGLLTAFTPCVYPLIPITIRYFGGMRVAAGARRRTLLLAVTYTAGMILLYALLGTVSAASRSVFGSLLASRWFVGAMAAFCAVMGASMLGLFSLHLPSGLNTRLSQVGDRSVGGAFLMGLVSGLVAAPCTGPVLLVILTVIAASGGIGVGFLLMVAFGLGLGLPFLFLAMFSQSLALLPPGGAWMELVKAVLATAMFVVAIYFLRFAWPASQAMLAAVPHSGVFVFVLLVAGTAFSIGYLFFLNHRRAAFLDLLGVAGLSLGTALALFGGVGSQGSGSIGWESAHDAALQRAHGRGLAVMIDFTAEWCVACKELEHSSYVYPGVVSEAERFVAVRVDATTMDDSITALFDRYGVLGLPTVVFIDSGGKVLGQPRVTGFVSGPRLLELMRQVK